MDLNTAVVLIYFVFLIAIGWAFRNLTSNTSDYFRGGGNVLWWMVGASAFMTQFSSWTFTGAAGKAYTDGIAVAFIFVGNAIGFFLNYLYFAPRFRQMRVVTVVEALRLRFGKTNEQAFAWVNMFTTMISASIALNGLAIVTSTIFDYSMEVTIIATGLVVLIMSVTGGAWAVIASDFMQMIVIVAVTVACAAVGIYEAGGFMPIVEKFPGDFVAGSDMNYMAIIYVWAFSIFLKQIGLTNNILYSYRYLTAKDSNNARKGALLACLLMTLGPIIWFIPSWFMAGSGIDISAMHPELGAKYADAAYLAFVEIYMPVGMIGLLVAAMFAATMSSIDSGLNRNAGIFVKNFVQPVLVPNISESRLMIVSRVATICFGAIIISLALFLNSLKELSLFDAMLYMSALLGFPQMIPSFLGFFIRKTPDWAAWATIMVGAIVSYFIAAVLEPAHVQQLLGLSTEFTRREWTDLTVTISLFSHIVITGGFFCLTTLFYKELPAERSEAVERFFTNIHTPLVKEERDHAHLDNRQRILLGRMVAIAGILVMALMAMPNPLWGRLVFLACGALVFLVGFALFSATTDVPEGHDSDEDDVDDGADISNPVRV
ncbi:transporter [Halioglobus maricola]|uniref:Transporter n=1 Tax=Halioglobus maricola TaxID=2601894 RepID=A0A5P9NN16_9GAMM|nr:transporter [Halioglobus maricola]QFU76318.1 transporter [Halioglobus maricola]